MIARFSALTICTVILAACGADRSAHDIYRPRGLTGGFDTKGVPYTNGGDTRSTESMRKAEEEESAAQPVPKGAKTNAPAPKGIVRVKNKVSDSLANFNLERFADGAAEASRFGNRSFKMTVTLKDGHEILFTGKLAGAGPRYDLQVAKSSDADYALTGWVNDVPTRKFIGSKWEQTEGAMVLNRKSAGLSAEIFYWAYRAKLDPRADRSTVIAQNSEFARTMKALQPGKTFPWVQSWTVTGGQSAFKIMIWPEETLAPAGSQVDLALKPLGPALIAVEGQTKDASEEDVELTPLTKNTVEDAKLFGAQGGGPGKILVLTMLDKQASEKHEVYVGINVDKDYGPARPPSAPKLDTPPPAEDDDMGVTSEEEKKSDEFATLPDSTDVLPDAKPSQHAPPKGAPAQAPPAIRGQSYFNFNSQKTMARKLVRDFDRNYGVRGVRDFMTKLKGTSKLTNFFNYANPFREMIEAIGEKYGVGPAYVFVTMVESRYFYGKKYEIQWNGNVRGPGQFKPGTAIGMGMALGGGYDERAYFAPSACAMAKYFRYNTGIFDDSDSTLAILAYNQGEGGAAAAIYCAYDSAMKGKRSQCMSRINKRVSKGGFDGYGRFVRAAKNYNFTYAQMAEMDSMPVAFRKYLDEKLATYFMSKNFRKYAPALPTNMLTRMPSNKFGPRPEKDPECRAVVNRWR